MPEISVLQEEQRMLRNELTQLKGCQLQYFTLSVTGTAALFGLAAIRNESAFLGVAFLTPLAIVLPCWWIFFDKATTITRIVGYYRVIERMIAEHPNCDITYIGYESALALYRREDDARGRDGMRKNSGPHKHIRHRYWAINWYTYATLSTSCCVLSLMFLVLGPSVNWLCLIPAIGFLAVAVFACSTRRLLYDVTHGHYSYSENHRFWEDIHRKYAPAPGQVAARVA